MNPTGGEQWELGTDGLWHCHRHPDAPAFERGEVCHACTADPGKHVTAIEVAADDGEAKRAESELQSNARSCLKLAKDLEDDGTAQDMSVAAKYRELYLKHMRLWREMRTERMTVQRDAELVEHDRKVSGLRGPN